MDWSDDGIVLSARKYGESAAIVTLLTLANGRHAGLVRGGTGRRARGIYQPGNRVRATWRARLADHLGSYSCELTHSWAADILDDSLRLMALSAACAMTEVTLAEREPHPALFQGLTALLSSLASRPETVNGTEPGNGDDGGDAGGDDGGDAGFAAPWPARYARWELMLLSELGFGLDLASCAVTGASDDLVFVSPRTGRAVSSDAGAPYKERLLPLPAFLTMADTPDDVGTPTREDINNGLALTGYFLERNVFAVHDRAVPAARIRLVEALARR
ncbi:MAG: DNA repair protein RecO [Alphaproteobacteria bacterium]